MSTPRAVFRPDEIARRLRAGRRLRTYEAEYAMSREAVEEVRCGQVMFLSEHLPRVASRPHDGRRQLTANGRRARRLA